MRNFRDILDSDTIQVFDGAMGTMLYSKGIYINRSYDELNLVAPDLVRDVHTEYVRAGADVIETNTYSSTFHKLQPYGLEASLREINIKAAQIAREAAGNRVFVAGAVGPLGLRIEPYGPTSFDEAKAMFTAQVSALLEGGVDPAIVLNAIEKMRPVTARKLSAQPNAGLPRDVQGRQFYMCSPEYMAEYSRRIIQAGARFVGGCCGTTPAHIKWIADAVRQFSPRTQQVVVGADVKVTVHDLKPPDVTVVPSEERSNWARKIARGEFVTTVEV